MKSTTTGNQEKFNQKIGAILKFMRNKSHLSQEKIAEALSISRNTYASWEKGLHTPSLFHIFCLKSTFNFSHQEFWNIIEKFINKKT